MNAEHLVALGVAVALIVPLAYLLGATRSKAPKGRAIAKPRSSSPSPRRTRDAAKASSPAAVERRAPSHAARGVARLDYDEDDSSEEDATRIGRPRLAPTVTPIVFDGEAHTDEPTGAESLFLVSASAQTHKGMRRKRNEDSLLVSEKENLFVVADGMGGHAGGDLASYLAVKTLRDCVSAPADEIPAANAELPRAARSLAYAIQSANDAILDTAKRERLDGMGTTICAARFAPNKERLYVGHVGDSRCYRLRDGKLRQLTADHTMGVLGVTGPAAAHLSRAVGVWPVVPIDIVMAVPQRGDVYLLCSDGLTKMLDDEQIADILLQDEEPEVAAARLVAAANARGGIDNVTVILVRVVPPNWKAARASAPAEFIGPAAS